MSQLQLLGVGVGLQMGLALFLASRLETVSWRFSAALMLTAGLLALVLGHVAGVAVGIFSDQYPSGIPVDVLVKPWIAIRAPGAIAGVLLAYWLFSRRNRPLTLRTADASALVAGVAVVGARYGCWSTGCCMPLAPWYMVTGLALIAIGIARRLRREYEGQVAVWVLTSYCAIAVVLEGFRYGAVFWGPIPQLQWLALALLTLSAMLGVRLRRRGGDADVMMR